MSCSSTAHDTGTSGATPGKAGLGGRRQVLRAPELLDHAAHVGERLEGVLEHVQVMVRVLLHAAQPVELRQDHRERPPHGEVAEGRGRFAGGEQRRELVAEALAAHGRQAAAARVRRGHRSSRVGHEVEAARQSRETHDPQRVVVERRRRAQAQAARGEVVETAQRVDELVAVERPGHRVHREVAGAQVGLEPGASRRRVGRGRPLAAAAALFSGATSTCMSPSTSRQVPNASDEANTAPPRRSARVRENGSAAPSTTMSTSRTGRPSSSSRRQPPTSQPASPGPRAERAAAVTSSGDGGGALALRAVAHERVRRRGRRRGSGARTRGDTSQTTS